MKVPNVGRYLCCNVLLLKTQGIQTSDSPDVYLGYCGLTLHHAAMLHFIAKCMFAFLNELCLPP